MEVLRNVFCIVVGKDETKNTIWKTGVYGRIILK
jgi:hypothetical protein